ncbi:hypothetical protein DUNSADRAFT_10215 [Dunaliella salina]|uniref:Uncharacterized protein n=1 Tax=Dunaliella salina TaxID=3046 RepID=A0ABQ7FSC8_DUNSA|nr:hypothetical protein DUNSADRAFT_10215 [Dunaliella salina]|eukprot:KAF5825423.1 hypothetical protein DUNSADRAFT_10215 [Dunaliella salina]
MYMCIYAPLTALAGVKARRMLFYPGPRDMALYPKLLASNGSRGESQEKCLTHALTCLYLVHSHVWDRVKPFIEAGGCM